MTLLDGKHADTNENGRGRPAEGSAQKRRFCAARALGPGSPAEGQGRAPGARARRLSPSCVVSKDNVCQSCCKLARGPAHFLITFGHLPVGEHPVLSSPRGSKGDQSEAGHAPGSCSAGLWAPPRVRLREAGENMWL